MCSVLFSVRWLTDIYVVTHFVFYACFVSFRFSFFVFSFFDKFFVVALLSGAYRSNGLRNRKIPQSKKQGTNVSTYVNCGL